MLDPLMNVPQYTCNTVAKHLQHTCKKNIRRASGIEWQHFRSFDECAATHLKRTCKAPATHLQQAFPDAHLSVLHSNVRLGSFDECEATHLQDTKRPSTDTFGFVQRGDNLLKI